MKRIPRTALAAVAVAAGSILLAGCSSGGEDTGVTTVNWWSWNPDIDSAEPYIEAFEAEHPEIKIEHRFIQYADYANTVTLGIQSGSGPDIFGTQVGTLTAQFAPLAEDLTPVISEALGDDWTEQLSASEQLTVDGKQVALPWMVTGAGLMWANQTVVDGLGLTVPTTMSELETFCAAVEAAGIDCIQQGAKDAWQNIDVFQAIINQIAPGEFYDAIAGEADFDSDDFVQAFEVWKSFFDKGLFEDGALGYSAYPDASDTFRKGGAALEFMGSWENNMTTQRTLDSYVETYGDDALATNVYMPYFFPQVVDGGTTGTLFGGPDVGFAIADNSAVKEAAHTFLLWLTAEEGGQSIMAKTVTQPALASVPLDLSDVVTDAQREALEAQGPALADLVGARQIPNADVETALGDALSSVASGQQTAAQAAAAVQATIDAANG